MKRYVRVMKARMSKRLREVLATPTSARDLRKAMAERAGTVTLDGKIYRLSTRPQQIALVPHAQGIKGST